MQNKTLKVFKPLQKIHDGTLVGAHGVKPLKDFILFTSGGQITQSRRNLVNQGILSVISMQKCFKTRFYED